MDAWRDIRLRARDFHRQALAAANGDRTSAALVKAALFIENLQLRYFARAVRARGSTDTSTGPRFW